MSAYGWSFCRLALSSYNGGCRYRLGAAATATQPLGSGALHPARSCLLLCVRCATALQESPAPRSHPKWRMAHATASLWGRAQHYCAGRASSWQGIPLFTPRLSSGQSGELPMVAHPTTRSLLVVGRLAHLPPLLRRLADGRASLIGGCLATSPPLSLVVLRALPLRCAVASS